ncbi:A-kinase anchor protein 14-like [Ceratina calcarata]|uniref:A-kinase anchor protein 14-like n=1 Tax=Ceratina calcarata TaxID=156304 RepID=A0AAJ7S8E5_9HYME|nr:A-kinase anchor protein 14-like [Ceratina calcarata]
MILGKQRSIYNIRPEVEEHEYRSYRSSSDFIRKFIELAIINALKIIDNLGELVSDEETGISKRKLGVYGNWWATCDSFNARNGLKSVVREMQSWNAIPVILHILLNDYTSASWEYFYTAFLQALKDWMFHVNFIGLQYKSNVEIYTYQVIWSVPTPAYPEPQVTANVYFYVVASRVYPPLYPVDVTYIFEGHQLAHTLNMIFRPKWLYDIFDMKTMMCKTFDF